MALEHARRQCLFAQILVVVATQGFADEIESVLTVAGEILFGKTRGQDLLCQEIGEGLQIVAMDCALEDESVLVAVGVDVGGHGIERVQHFSPGPAFGSCLAQHGGSQSGQTAFACWIVGGADLKKKANGDQGIVGRGQGHATRALADRGGARARGGSRPAGSERARRGDSNGKQHDGCSPRFHGTSGCKVTTVRFFCVK